MRIIDRYLLKELAVGFFAAAFILLLITVGGTVADILAKIARGRIPAELLFSLIGLRTLDALTVLLPLAVFLGVLLAYGRLWRDSEMAVLQASGLSMGNLARPLWWMALPVVLMLGFISFWLAPASVRLSQRLLEEASRSLILAGLEPGRFVELPGKDGMLYVGEMSDDGTRFKRLFVENEHADNEGKTRLDVITATHGELYHDADGSGRYLALHDGFRVEGKLGEDDFRLIRFQRNDIKLPDNEKDESADGAKRAAPTLALMASKEPALIAELHWRLATPLSGVVLMLLALPLSRANPREPRYANLLIAVLFYLTYANCLALGRSWISQGELAPEFGLWWVYIPTLLLAVWLIRHGQRLHKTTVTGRGA